jgi:hypothetical protein
MLLSSLLVRATPRSCSAPPAEEVLSDFQLVGDPQKKNGACSAGGGAPWCGANKQRPPKGACVRHAPPQSQRQRLR